MNDLNTALVALFKADSTLAGSASGGTYHHVVPRREPPIQPPYLVFEKVNGSAVWTLTQLAASDFLYGFAGYGKDTDDQSGSEIAGAISERAEIVLRDCNVAVGALTLQYARKETDLPDTESLDQADGQMVYRRAFIGRLMVL